MLTAYTLIFGGLLLLGVGSLTTSVGVGSSSSAWSASRVPPPRGLAQKRCGTLRRSRPAGRVRGAAGARGAFTAVGDLHRTGRAGEGFRSVRGISAGGAALGLIVGGALTEYASWRWCCW